jgi:hypothetical protein
MLVIWLCRKDLIKKYVQVNQQPKKKGKGKKKNADLPRTAIHNNLQQSGWAAGRVSRERSRSGGNTDHTTRAEQNQLPVLTGKGSVNPNADGSPTRCVYSRAREGDEEGRPGRTKNAGITIAGCALGERGSFFESIQWRKFVDRFGG